MKNSIIIISILGVLSCSPPIYTNKTLNGKSCINEIISKYGYPDYSDTILLTHNYPLYEYQAELSKYYPPEGCYKTIVEITYIKRNKNILKIWYEPNKDNSITILDNLEWDPEEIQF